MLYEEDITKHKELYVMCGWDAPLIRFKLDRPLGTFEAEARLQFNHENSTEELSDPSIYTINNLIKNLNYFLVFNLNFISNPGYRYNIRKKLIECKALKQIVENGIRIDEEGREGKYFEPGLRPNGNDAYHALSNQIKRYLEHNQLNIAIKNKREK